MKKYQLVSLLWLFSSMNGQNLVDLRTQSKNVDFSSAASTIPTKSGTTLPATCNAGEMFFKTNSTPGQNLYGCAPANTWTLLSGTTNGTVSPATAGQFGFYSTSGSLIVGHTLTASDIPALGYQASLTFTGTGAKTASSTGTLIGNNCAKWDANGNIIDAGSPCGSVATGTAGQFPFYAANGTALTAHSLAASDIPALNYQSPLTFTGNGAKTVTAAGTSATNDCVKWDANGNIVDSGLPCANVAAGSTGQFAFYSANGSALSAHTLTASDIPTLAYQAPLSFTGTGSKTASSTGVSTANNCAKWDASGNIIDAGTPCGSGTGGVASFNTRTGAITLSSGDITAALTYTPLSAANNLSELANAATARSNLGLNTAANYPVLNQNTTGNALTASSFDHTPTGCGGGQFASGIAASGNLTCATPAGGGNVSTSANMTNGNVPKATGTNTLSDGGQAYPTSPFVGLSDAQTLTNKSISGSQINSGTIPIAQLPVATSSALGAVKPDNSTITISGGVLSAVAGSGGGATIPQTTSVLCGNGSGNGSACNGAVTGNSSTTTLRDFLSVKDFGAVNDGTTDSYTPLQNAINAACVTTARGPAGQGAKLLIPGGTAEYRISKPLVVPCSNVIIEGQDQSTIIKPTYGFGSVLNIRPQVASGYWPAFPTTTGLVGGGNAMLLDGSGSEYLDLGEVIAPGALNGLGAFTIECWIQPTSVASDATYLSSFGNFNGSASYAFFLGIASAVPYARLTVGGTQHIINATSAIAAGVSHMIALTYDGSNIRFFIDGVVQSTQAATGTVTQLTTENVTVGPLLNEWPLGAALSNSFSGAIDNIRISSTARYTSAFTPPSAKFTSDANTLLLLTFANNFDAFTQAVQQAGPGWLMYRTTSLSTQLNDNVTVSHLTLTQYSNSGFVCNFTPNSHFNNIRVIGGYRGMSFESNCFESVVNDPWMFSQTGWDMMLGQANTVFALNNAHFNGGVYHLALSGDPDVNVKNGWFQVESNTVHSVTINAEGQNYDFVEMDHDNFSTESGPGSTFVDLIQEHGMGGILNVNDSNFGQVSNLPSITVVGGNRISIKDTLFTGSTTTPTINVVSPPSTPIIWQGNSRFATTQPISNVLSSLLNYDSAVGFPSSVATLTGGTGVTSVTCTSTLCDTNGGSLTIVGGSATTGVVATVTYPALSAAPRTCTVSQNGGTTQYGIGHGTPSTSAFTITAGVSVSGATINVDYTCKP